MAAICIKYTRTINFVQIYFVSHEWTILYTKKTTMKNIIQFSGIQLICIELCNNLYTETTCYSIRFRRKLYFTLTKGLHRILKFGEIKKIGLCTCCSRPASFSILPLLILLQSDVNCFFSLAAIRWVINGIAEFQYVKCSSYGNLPHGVLWPNGIEFFLFTQKMFTWKLFESFSKHFTAFNIVEVSPFCSQMDEIIFFVDQMQIDFTKFIYTV